MDNYPEEENSDWNRIQSYNTSPDDPHEFGECMEDRKEMDSRREGLKEISGGRL